LRLRNIYIRRVSIKIHIFTDASVDPISRKGIGCYIIMNDLNEPFSKQNIVSLEFDDVSSIIA